MSATIEPDVSMNQSTTEKTTWPVHIEVRVSPKRTVRVDTIKKHVHSYLTSSFDRITVPSTVVGWENLPVLGDYVQRIVACESACPSQSLSLEEVSLQIHVYQPCESETLEEFANGPRRGDEEEVMSATMCELPNLGMEGLWESLIYADNIKLKLLDYIYATLILSDANIDLNLVSWNRVVLLHGPPGTGKTSLCRALAQKLAIRLSDRYVQTRLLEINSHSLFSRWFSESGKLVQRLFSSITELVEEEETFVVVLMDEVESLTAARAGAMAGTEPSDGLRVVNALLTQLDKLKNRKNVLIMATSNLPKAIDSAFVDRADIIQYVDLPSRDAIYNILGTCLNEMISKGVVKHVTVPTLQQALMCEMGGKAHREHDPSIVDDRAKSVALRLISLSVLCREHGMSGRALRRLPVLALARYIGLGSTAPSSGPRVTSGMQSGIGVSRTSSTAVDPAGGKKDAALKNLLGGAADVQVWLDRMEKVIVDSSEEVGRFS